MPALIIFPSNSAQLLLSSGFVLVVVRGSGPGVKLCLCYHWRRTASNLDGILCRLWSFFRPVRPVAPLVRLCYLCHQWYWCRCQGLLLLLVLLVLGFAAIDNETPAVLMELDAGFGLPPFQLGPVTPLVRLCCCRQLCWCRCQALSLSLLLLLVSTLFVVKLCCR